MRNSRMKHVTSGPMCGTRVCSMTVSDKCATHVLDKGKSESRLVKAPAQHTQMNPCWWSVNSCLHACKKIHRDTNQRMHVKCAHVGKPSTTLLLTSTGRAAWLNNSNRARTRELDNNSGSGSEQTDRPFSQNSKKFASFTEERFCQMTGGEMGDRLSNSRATRATPLPLSRVCIWVGIGRVSSRNSRLSSEFSNLIGSWMATSCVLHNISTHGASCKSTLGEACLNRDSWTLLAPFAHKNSWSIKQKLIWLCWDEYDCCARPKKTQQTDGSRLFKNNRKRESDALDFVSSTWELFRGNTTFKHSLWRFLLAYTFLATDWNARLLKNETRMAFSIVFVRGSATCKCVGNHCSEMFSTGLNPSRSMDTTILNLLSWLCPTTFLTVFAKLSLSVNTSASIFKLSFSTSFWELRAMCASVNRCRNHWADSRPSDTTYQSVANVDLTTLLMVELCQLAIVLRSKHPVFQQLRMMSETKNQTTLRFLSFSVCETNVCVTNNGTNFQIHDTTRNDNAHFSRAVRLLDKFVQLFDIGERRLAQFLSSQRHTNTQIWQRLLSQPQQLSQHALVSNDLSARVCASRSSWRQIDAHTFDAHRWLGLRHLDVIAIPGDGPTTIHDRARLLFQMELVHKMLQCIPVLETFLNADRKSSTCVCATASNPDGPCK